MAVNDIYKVALLGKGPQDQDLVNTLYYKALTGTILDEQVTDLVAAVQAKTTFEGNTFTPLFHAAVSYVGIEVRGVTDPTVGADLLFDTPIPGEQTGQCMPPSDSPVVTFTTGKIGRAFRGRNYLWPFSESNQDAGALASGMVAAMAAYAQDMRSIGDGLLTAVYQQVIWSRTNSVATPVTGATARAFVYSQRRRTAGYGS